MLKAFLLLTNLTHEKLMNVNKLFKLKCFKFCLPNPSSKDYNNIHCCYIFVHVVGGP